jgi:hypothetical protein
MAFLSEVHLLPVDTVNCFATLKAKRIAASDVATEPHVVALLADLTGQVEQALSRDDWYSALFFCSQSAMLLLVSSER